MGVTGTDVNKEFRMEGDLEIAHTDLEEVTHMDTLLEVVGMLPEEEEGKEMEPVVGKDSQPIEMGSVVVCTHCCSDQLPLLKKVWSWAV